MRVIPSLWFLAVLLSPGILFAEGAATNSVISSHLADLVILNGDKLVPFKSEHFFQAPYTVLYFGAGWCPDCRRFSPALVEAYDHQPRQARRFEVMLISRDKDPEGMRKFMTSEKMPWPALAFEKIETAADLTRFYSGHGIPCLAVLDSRGAVVLQSKDDQDGLEILHQLQELATKR